VLIDSLRYTALGLLLPAAVGGGAAEAVMRVFGGGFGVGAAALQWLLLFPVLQTLMAIQGAALMASDRPLVTSLVQIARLLLTLGGGIALSLVLGMTGMAIAVAGGALVGFAVYVAVLTSHLGIAPPSPAHCRQAAGLACAYVSGFGASHLIERGEHGILGLGSALLGGSLAYVVAGIVVSGLTDRDRQRLRGTLAWMTARRQAMVQGLT
jgi:O-antigen/teichoic acid export membrane protein